MTFSREPFSVPDDLAGEWQDMVRRNRLMQGDPFSQERNQQGGLAPDDNLPMRDWQEARNAQVRGLPWSGASPAIQEVRYRSPSPAGAGGVTVRTRPSPPPAGPLRGRPGLAGAVSGLLNTLASGPNTSGSLSGEDISGEVRRGAGADVHAQVHLPKMLKPIQDIDATGRIEQTPGRAEITILDGHARAGGVGLRIPPRIRVYTTPTGELDYDLPSPITFGPMTILKPGRYVIGDADPPSGRQ